jgi:hypothetical protein
VSCLSTLSLLLLMIAEGSEVEVEEGKNREKGRSICPVLRVQGVEMRRECVVLESSPFRVQLLLKEKEGESRRESSRSARGDRLLLLL